MAVSSVSSDLITYRNEIFRFLQSLTLKSGYLAVTYNDTLEGQGEVVNDLDPETWKYYLNLTGEYHSSDTVMTVLSLDTQERVDFTKEMLSLHPRTAAVFIPGTAEYRDLCNRYPHQTDLIKNIVYPVRDMAEAIDAPEFTILQYGHGFLEPEELMTVLHDMREFLEFSRDRWYMDYLYYEPYFYPTYWGYLWQLLVMCVHSTRIRNLHTAHVHSFHVWEYLTSHGIGDYRDVLTRRQAMFLYRNMQYILEHRGEHDNLILLVDELLTEQNIAMMSKTLVQQTVDGAVECRWIPEFTSSPIQTRYAKSARLPPPQTTEEITYRLADIGADNQTSLEDIARMERELARTTSSQLPTKLLEIQPVPIDRKYSDLLNNFVLDTLVGMINDGQYETANVLVDGQTGIKLNLSAKDALILYYLAVHKARGETVTNLPTLYTPLAGAYKKGVDVSALPKTVTYKGDVYQVSSFVDTAAFVGNAIPPVYGIVSSNEFSEYVGTAFGDMVRQVNTIRQTNTESGCKVLWELFTNITERKTYTLSLSTSATYSSWFLTDGAAGCSELVSSYDGLSQAAELYDTLADQIIKALVPPEAPALSKYMDSLDDQEFFGRMKELFVQLCSYNVLFMDTKRNRQHWEFFAKDTVTPISQVHSAAAYENSTIRESGTPSAHDKVSLYLPGPEPKGDISATLSVAEQLTDQVGDVVSSGQFNREFENSLLDGNIVQTNTTQTIVVDLSYDMTVMNP